MKAKVLHVVSSLGKGGKERQLLNIIRYSPKEVHSSVVVMFHTPRTYVDDYNFGDIISPLIMLKRGKKLAKPFLLLYSLARIVHIIKKQEYDIVWTWGDEDSFVVLLASLFCSFKMINGSIRYGERRSYHYFKKLLLILSPRILANSKAGASVYGLPARILYNGSVMPERINRIHNSDVVRFVSVANLKPNKDYIPIINVMSKMKYEGIKFKYYILGEGKMRRDIENAIQKNHLTDEISLCGSVTDVYAYLGQADVFIHSSSGEGCSNAIIEAMGAGLPIVSSDVGGVRETVTKDNAILYTYRNEAQLYKAIMMLVRSTELRIEMGRQSLNIAHEKFSIEAMVYSYRRIIMDTMYDRWGA